jgi:excisionase family DNA binding protein
MKPIAITIPQATETSGLGRSTIYELFAEKKLTPRKAGRRTLILFEELEAYLKSLPASGGRDASAS